MEMCQYTDAIGIVPLSTSEQTIMDKTNGWWNCETNYHVTESLGRTKHIAA